MDTPEEGLNKIERSHLIAYGEHIHAYYRQFLGLSSAALTILLALQKHYVPQSPVLPILVQVCWASLALCVVLSLLLLWGRAQTRLDAANALRKERRSKTDQAVLEMLRSHNGAWPPERKIFSVARYLQSASFLIALVSLTWFSIANV